MSFELARRIADTVLYEGYILYPYRASAPKNHVRFQFGVVAPAGFAQSGGGEPDAMQSECVLESAGAPVLDVRLRFLQLQRRTIERETPGAPGSFTPVESLDVDGRELVTWDEGVEREVDYRGIDVGGLLEARRDFDLRLPGGCEIEPLDGHARIVRERSPIEAVVKMAAEQYGHAVKVRIRIENVTSWNLQPTGATGAGSGPAGSTDRDSALRQSLVGAHTLVAVRGGAFVSLLDPPDWAADAVAGCLNIGTWPVLVGEPGQRDILLSSPIILYDYPAIAPESQGDFCDGTEIDEMLALRVMTLTDDEKREARATDERAKQIVDRVDSLPPEMLDRLHGAIRYLQGVNRGTGRSPREGGAHPIQLETADPERETLEVAGVRVSKGSRVRLQPKRRADAMDFFLNGMTARVEGVYHDIDDRTWVAVTVEGDPASELHDSYGRFFYFYPDEIEPLGGVAAPPATHERKAES
jgi:hypothetical protein